MQEDGSLTPQTIPNTPIPLLTVDTTGNISGTTQMGSPDSINGLTPPTIGNSAIPDVKIANDIIGTSLDTNSRKILSSFGFGKVGAIEIGSFKQDVSGDVRISPNGIIGRNKIGLDYFTMDEDGITITDGIDQTIVDSQGIRSTSQFKNGNITSASTFTTTSTSYLTIPGSSFSITTTRQINILFSIFVYISNNQWITNGNETSVDLYDDFLAGEAVGALTTGGNAATDVTFPGGGTSVTERIATQGIELISILQVDSGTHNYQLRMKAVGGGTANLDAFVINFLTLGT